MRRAPLRNALLLLLVVAAGLASQAQAQQQVPSSISLSMAEPPPTMLPGGSADATLTVEYCYASAPAVPGRIDVRVNGAPAWATASVDPTSVQATTTGGQRCGSQTTTVHVGLTRAAPAFAPEFLRFGASSGSRQAPELQVPVQADYVAEVQLAQSQKPSIPKSDSGQLRLRITVAANEATFLEVVGSDPSGRLTLLGRRIDTQAGRGLDEPDARDEVFTVAVSPGAAEGAQKLPLNVTSHYVRRPDITGQSVVFQADIVVAPGGGGGGNPLPGFEAAGLLAAVAALALAPRARRR